MSYLDPKGEGNSSMTENRWSRPDGWSDAPGGPHDMAKSGLTKPQSPGMQKRNIRRKTVCNRRRICVSAYQCCRHNFPGAADTQ
jgi:hypothetical protein